MFIEISKEVAVQCAKISDPLDELSLTINAILTSMVDRKHIVFINSESIDIIQKCTWLNPSNKIAVQWIKNKQIDLYAIKNKSATKIIVTLDEYNEVDGTILMPFKTLRKLTESKFLCENETDYDFYVNIYKFFNNNNFYSVCLNNCSFHGGNVELTIKKESLNNSFILCFVDSDKEYINGKKGATCKCAIAAINNIRNLPKLLYVTNGREKENLFPFSYYLKRANDKKVWIKSILEVCRANEDFLRYVDIKDGIKVKRIKDNRYIENYQELLERLMQNKFCSLTCIDSCEDDDYCIKGIGADFLAEIQNDFFSEYSYNLIQNTNKKDEIFGNQSFIIHDWKEISQLIFDFGCCLSDNINFNV